MKRFDRNRIFKPPIFTRSTEENKTGTSRTTRPIFWQDRQTVSSCVMACPINQEIREWISWTKIGEFKKALDVLTEKNPLPATLGRVCSAFCQKACLRRHFDETVSIRLLERFLGDWAIEHYVKEIPRISKEKRVAVVGSGPAGLACAHSLRQRGYLVSVFEEEKKIGGLLAWGIPDDRLPKEILRAEIALHLKGVDFCPNTEIGEANFEDLKKEFQAIFLAPGFGACKKLGIQGESFPEVISGLDFLKAMILGPKDYPLDRTLDDVIVVGGGNTAMDCARVAKLSGIKRVRIFHRRDKFRASGEEQKAAQDLGIEFCFSTLLKRIWRADLRNPLLSFFAENRENGMISQDRTNLIVVAIGQEKESFWQNLLKENSPETLTSQGIFIGGDFLFGPRTVSHAVASGNFGAKKIIAYLEEKPCKKGLLRQKFNRIEDINLNYFEERLRLRNLPEGFGEDMKKSLAISEAERCFSCGLCQECDICWAYCGEAAIKRESGVYEVNYDYCKGCGICAKECPRGVIRMTKEEEG